MDMFAFLRENFTCHKSACDKKIQHLLCENIHKHPEIIVVKPTLQHQSTTVSFPRFTYGNHAATLPAIPYAVSVLTAQAQHTAKIIATFTLWRSRDYDRRR
jgi:hypothetical protein